MRRGRRTHRHLRLRLGALACGLLLTAAFSAGSASAAGLPPEGIFEGCQLDTQMQTCVQRLQVMHQGGMQVVVISASSGSLDSLASYAAAARSLGMSVMWELSDPTWWQDSPTSTSAASSFPAFATGCGCNQNGPLLAYTINWLSQLPGTYGYYAADDSMLSPGDQHGVAQYVAQIRQQDPAHTVMIGAADESQSGTYQRIADLIGTEIYPVTTDPLMPVSANQDSWGSVAQWASDTQHIADRAGKQSAFILQAFTWGDNLSDGQTIGACTASDTQSSCYSKLRYPSASEQLQLRNEVLLHAHPKLILWWSFPGTYGQTGTDTYSIYPTGAEASSRWSGLSAAVQAPYPGSKPLSRTSGQTGHPAKPKSPSRARTARRANRQQQTRHRHSRPTRHRHNKSAHHKSNKRRGVAHRHAKRG